MKFNIFYVCSLSVLLLNCTEDKKVKTVQDNSLATVSVKIPNITIDKSELTYNNKKSLWTLHDQPYSGYLVSYYQNSILKEKAGIYDGKKQNLETHYHAEGNLRQIVNYHKGKLHGEKKVWSSDSILLSHLNYQSGKPHGEQKTWYPTGELHKKLNLNRGREEGIQQAYRKNGALYANYEAKEGRIFGLKKASLCYGLENENVQYAK